jgi:tetratricopeptide (TPR) repeat protein
MKWPAAAGLSARGLSAGVAGSGGGHSADKTLRSKEDAEKMAVPSSGAKAPLKLESLMSELPPRRTQKPRKLRPSQNRTFSAGCKDLSYIISALRWAALRAGVGVFLGITLARGVCALPQQRPAPSNPIPASSNAPQSSTATEAGQAAANPAEELRIGTQLTSQGHFDEAIPHLIAARAQLPDDYAANFNLALCYVATNQPKQAIGILNGLRNSGHSTADVNNLLAQAYIATGQSQEAFDAFQHAAALTPNNEKLYDFVADACMEHRDYRLGAKIADLGLQKIPNSARLLYERGMFFAWLNHPDLSDADLERAHQLAPDTEIGYLAEGQKYMLSGNMEEAIRVAREGISKGHSGPLLLTMLAVALVQSGVSPGQPEFAEAQAALEKTTVEHPRDAVAQASLGKLYLLQGRLDDAVARLEIARQLDPSKKEVYSQLAMAYRRQGKIKQAQGVLAVLAKLNEQEAAAIREAPADNKGAYGAKAPQKK